MMLSVKTSWNAFLNECIKLLRTEGSRFGFLKMGRSTACLKECGKMPLFRELFIINKILGPTVSNNL